MVEPFAVFIAIIVAADRQGHHAGMGPPDDVSMPVGGMQVKSLDRLDPDGGGQPLDSGKMFMGTMIEQGNDLLDVILLVLLGVQA